MRKITEHKSKMSPDIIYVSTKISSRTYMEVRYKGNILMQFNRAPIAGVRRFISECEALLDIRYLNALKDVVLSGEGSKFYNEASYDTQKIQHKLEAFYK